MGIALVVGLGNPERQYADTRHNAGARFVQRLAARCGGEFRPVKRCCGRTASIAHGAGAVRLLLPDTAMNLSGSAVGRTLRYFGIDAADMLVAHDELDLPLSVARIKWGGGHGGHGGLRDILATIGGQDFYRLRLGIGRPAGGAVTPHVLGRMRGDEVDALAAVNDAALAALAWLLDGRPERAMTELHTALPRPKPSAAPSLAV